MPAPTTPDRVLGRRAAGQRGLITRQQALAGGCSSTMIGQRLSSGRWHRLGAGVYRVDGAPITWHQRAPDAVISHRSAAVLHGISGFRPGPMHLTVPAGRSARNPLGRVHRSEVLPEGDVTRLEGIPVTRPARSLIDLASVVGRDALEEAVDDVPCRRLVSLAELVSRTTDLAGRRGTASLARILEAWDSSPLPDGVAEMRVVRRLLAHGLPRPTPQQRITVAGNFIARVDLAYPEERLAIELDSFRWHAGRRHFRNDRQRGNRIAAAGWQVLRVTPDDIDAGGDELCRTVAALLRRPA